MRYVSTRGSAPALAFDDVLLAGLARGLRKLERETTAAVEFVAHVDLVQSCARLCHEAGFTVPAIGGDLPLMSQWLLAAGSAMDQHLAAFAVGGAAAIAAVVLLARTPAGRWGTPRDLAGLAVFLASPASNFVTGADIPCDGGYMSRG